MESFNRGRSVHLGENTVKTWIETWTKEENVRWAILIWNNFSAHLDADVTNELEQNRIKCFPLPPNCTSKYQPLDVLFNGLEKRMLRDNFSEWHFQALNRALKMDNQAVNVIPKSASMKRTLIATLIRGTHDAMAMKTAMIVNCWSTAGLMDLEAIPTEKVSNVIDEHVVQAMLDETSKDEKIEYLEENNPTFMEHVDDGENEEEKAIEDDVVDHMQALELYDEEEEQYVCEESSSDDDNSYPAPKRYCRNSLDDSESTTSIQSVETNKKVSLSIHRVP